MPFIQELLLKIPTILLGIIIVMSSVILAVITIQAVHYFIPYRKHNKTSGVTMILFGTKTLIYSVLVSLVLFTAWSDFKSAGLNVQREADCLIELHRSTEAFLPKIKEETHVLLEEYTRSVINDEWKTLTRSELSPHTTEIAKNIWKVYTAYSPQTETEQIFLQESIRKLYELRECRSTRLTDSKTGINPFLWLVLIAGEIAVIASIAFFAEDLRSKLSMSIFFAVLIGIIFFTIILYDFPFTGEMFVSPEPLKQALLYW